MPIIEKVEPVEQRRAWGREVRLVATPSYLSKVLYMSAGTKGGLQVHTEKDEAFHLFQGRATVVTDEGDGRLRSIPMMAGETYRIPPGAVHQVIADTDCVFFEVSTPHEDDRIRLEARYGLPTDGGLPTTR